MKARFTESTAGVRSGAGIVVATALRLRTALTIQTSPGIRAGETMSPNLTIRRARSRHLRGVPTQVLQSLGRASVAVLPTPLAEKAAPTCPPE